MSCLLPLDLAHRLERRMRHWGEEHGVEIILERRRHVRRAEVDRRAERWPEDDAEDTVFRALERRHIRNRAGRRVAERRATLIPVPAPAPLPRRAAVEEPRLVFVERLDLDAEHHEDTDSARLVTRLQGGEPALFAVLYERYFDRVYSYLRVALRDRHEAEDATQQVFLQVMEALPRYELREVPFRAWLFRVVRNYALNHVDKHGRIAVEDPAQLDRRRERDVDAFQPRLLDWLADGDLVMLVSRLPLPQRQVIMLRYMMDLSWSQVAEVLDRSPAAVRQLQQRAVVQLRTRLAAIGREPSASGRLPMARRHQQLPVLHARRNALLAA